MHNMHTNQCIYSHNRLTGQTNPVLRLLQENLRLASLLPYRLCLENMENGPTDYVGPGCLGRLWKVPEHVTVHDVADYGKCRPRMP